MASPDPLVIDARRSAVFWEAIWQADGLLDALLKHDCLNGTEDGAFLRSMFLRLQAINTTLIQVTDAAYPVEDIEQTVFGRSAAADEC